MTDKEPSTTIIVNPDGSWGRVATEKALWEINKVLQPLRFNCVKRE